MCGVAGPGVGRGAEPAHLYMLLCLCIRKGKILPCKYNIFSLIHNKIFPEQLELLRSVKNGKRKKK